MATLSIFLDEHTVSALDKLRVSQEDFEMKSTIGRGHFGEVLIFPPLHLKE